VVDLDLGAARGGAGAADHQVALGDRVDLAVGAAQRRGDQRAAAQALGIAHGRHDDVQRLAGLREGGELGGDHHRRDVARLHGHAGRQQDAELLQHRRHALAGEGGLRGLVAGAVQAHHQAVAGQRVGTHALDRGDLLDARRLGGRRDREQRHQREQAGSQQARGAGEEAGKGVGVHLGHTVGRLV